MEQRHREYIDYYRARLRKYENNSLYENSYASEKALLDAIEACDKLEDFKEACESRQLPFRNAIALMKDQESAWEKHYLEIKEVIRAKGCRAILDYLENAKDLASLISETNDMRNRTSNEISIDGFASEFYSAFTVLENIEVWEKAEVPSRWKEEMRENIRESTGEHRKLYHEVTLPAARMYHPAFRFDFDLVWEDRHRRLIPLKDETMKRRL
jgi:hypothetical protein